MKSKRGDVSFIIVIVVVIVIGVLVIVLKNVSEDIPEEEVGWEQVKNAFVEYDNIEYDDYGKPVDINVQVFVEARNGGGSGGGSSGDCSYRSIMYSIFTIDKIENCLEYDGEICISKDVLCKNRIDNEGGSFSEFETEFVIVPDGRNKSLYPSTVANYLLDGGEKYLIEKSIQFDSEGELGDANREVNCFLNVLNIPQEIIC